MYVTLLSNYSLPFCQPQMMHLDLNIKRKDNKKKKKLKNHE